MKLSLIRYFENEILRTFFEWKLSFYVLFKCYLLSFNTLITSCSWRNCKLKIEMSVLFLLMFWCVSLLWLLLSWLCDVLTWYEPLVVCSLIQTKYLMDPFIFRFHMSAHYTHMWWGILLPRHHQHQSTAVRWW